MPFIKKCLRTVSRALLFLRSNDLHDLLPLEKAGSYFLLSFEEEKW
ncbi:hypothetical protein HMPREF8577_1103 [Streptococcus parasanguinis ATCC 903]|nr:hypothetical protein HMPREF8577_1103 [Streptococcus parasanguinis ATCC 903]